MKYSSRIIDAMHCAQGRKVHRAAVQGQGRGLHPGRVFACMNVAFLIVLVISLLAAPILAAETPVEVNAQIWDTVNTPQLQQIGYTLLGFSKSADAVTPEFPASFVVDAEAVETLFPEDSTVTLFAVWEKTVYTALFDANDGTGSTEVRTLTIGDTADLSAAFTRAGHTLLGFSAEKAASEAEYPSDRFVLDAAQIMTLFAGDTVLESTLYAVWQIAEFSVVFTDSNGEILKTERVPFGGSAAAPTPPDREGFLFTGWDQSFINVQEDLTVRAQYERILLNEDEEEEEEKREDEPEAPLTILPADRNGGGPVEVIAALLPEETAEVEEAEEPETWGDTSTSIRYLGAPEISTAAQVVTHPAAVLALAKAEDIPIFDIGNLEIPLFAHPQMAVWALANLILCILGVLLAVLKIIRVLQENSGAHTNQGNGRTAQSAQSARPVQQGWLVASILLAATGLILYLLTPNVLSGHLMVFFDVWTIAHTAIFTIERIALSQVFGRTSLILRQGEEA